MAHRHRSAAAYAVRIHIRAANVRGKKRAIMRVFSCRCGGWHVGNVEPRPRGWGDRRPKHEEPAACDC